ncbi:MAG: hypothetical protein PVJ33_10730 [Lysobacterales bacterium]
MEHSMAGKRKVEVREPPKHSSRTVNSTQRKIADMQYRKRAAPRPR